MDEAVKSIVKKCLMLLARREYSQSELIKKMGAFPTETINQALDELVKRGHQSDERYAEAFVRSQLHRGKGAKIIHQALVYKGGIDKSLGWAALEAIDDGEWQMQCQRIYQKKFSTKPKNRMDVFKRIQYLIQRGYDSELAREIVQADDQES